MRSSILRAHGATDANIAEILAYNEGRFPQALLSQSAFPFQDEMFVEAWQEYLSVAEKSGVFNVLQQRLPQLNFPIKAGISRSEDYINATRRGKPVQSSLSLALEAPDDLALLIHPTAVGSIPVLIASCRADFVTLVRALSGRNEPIDVPDSMGASTVVGFNNWDRIHQFRARWQQENLGKSWNQYFPEFIKNRELYEDRFIILSGGSYSDVNGEQFGFDREEWLGISFKIRLEHECAHYFMLRALGSIKNNLFDEVIADYAGIKLANQKHYKADWFLTFMGLEGYPVYRHGGRLQNYTSELSEPAVEVLHSLVATASERIEQFSEGLKENHSLGDELLVLCSMTLEQLAAESAVANMNASLAKIRH